MKYFRKVDFDAFPKDEFKGQTIADSTTGFDEGVFVVVHAPPGKESTAGLHTHSVDQFYYVLEGTLGIQLGKDKHELKAHTLVYIPPGVTHTVWNSSSEPETHIELLCPRIPEGEPRVTPASAPSDVPAGVQLIRTVDWAAFDTSPGLSQNLASRASGVESLSWNVFRMPPGKGVSTPHMHGFTHVYYIIQGTLQIQMGFEEHNISAGTMGIIPPWMVHCNRNDGPETQINLNIRIPEASTPYQQGSQVQIMNPQGRTPAG